MRTLIIATALAGLVTLTACDGAVSQAEATPPPAAKKKSLARPAQMYAGQDQIQAVQSGTVEFNAEGGVILTAKGTTASAGWSDAGFLPRIYAATPPDGIYEVDVIATQPSGPSAQVVTPIEADGEWNRYTDGRVKGIKFMTKTNELVVMAAPKPAAAAGQ